MILLFLSACLLTSCNSLTEAHLTHQPRMIFTEKEATMKRFLLPDRGPPVRILVDGDTVTVVGRTHLKTFDLQNPDKAAVEKKVLWRDCRKDCNYNIVLVEKTNKDNEVLVCGTNGKDTLCCSMILTEETAQCIPSENMETVENSIQYFTIKEGEPFVLVPPTSTEDAALFITHSGSQDSVGIHKFGKKKIQSVTHPKEQHYVGLMLNERKEDELQNRVYAFYKEKNKDARLDSEMWLPYVTQVCMADNGGPKNNLQFSWTSQMNARLYCGDPKSKQFFSELIDVAIIHAERWQDTKVYALFNNEWGLTAVCVYTLQQIDNIFINSPFKGSGKETIRSRKCVPDSTMISFDVLNLIKMNSEMEDWVMPLENSPLLINRHRYTHIQADSSQQKMHPVLFLSLENGGVHKVTQNKSHAFVIAEYQPFNQGTHILSITLNQTSRKLYVSSPSELVQMDVENCDHYGNTCQECVLARDPYCAWNGTHCISATQGTLQDVDKGNYDKCIAPRKAHRSSADRATATIKVPSESKYFLHCPVTSHHAQYKWTHDDKPVPCSMADQQCLLLIDSMGPEQVGSYKCESKEMGYSKVLAQYKLEMGSGSAVRSSSPLVLLCLVVTLIKIMYPAGHE